MTRNRSAVIGAAATVLCLFASHASADWNAPALPVCKPQHEWRTPVPVWTPGIAKDRRLDSVPPEPTTGVIYIDVGVASYAPACRDQPENGIFEFDVPRGTMGAPDGLRLKIADDQMGYDSFRDCMFNGFYTPAQATTLPNDVRELTLRPLDKFTVIASGRYCRADAGAAAHLLQQAPIAPPATMRESPWTLLPTCRAIAEDRIEIPVWEPRFTSHGGLRSVPPQDGDGKLVFMAVASPIDCLGAAPDLDLPASAADPQSGTSVDLNGRFRSENKHCVWSGLYMNDAVGYQHGWATTSFIQVDEAKVASSGQFCLTRRHGPLRRPAPLK
jgi:hypothetical protein